MKGENDQDEDIISQINNLLEDKTENEIQDILYDSEIEQTLLNSKIKTLKSNLNQNFPNIVSKVSEIISEEGNSKKLLKIQNISRELRKLENINSLDEHLSRMTRFDKYSQLIRDFRDFKNKIESPDLEKTTDQNFLNFLLKNREFILAIRKNNKCESQVNTEFLVKRIKICYTNLLVNHIKPVTRDLMVNIIEFFPISQESKAFKENLLSQMIRETVNKDMGHEEYISFLRKCYDCIILLDIMSSKQILQFDFLVFHSFLVSIKGIKFDFLKFNSLKLVNNDKLLFNGKYSIVYLFTYLFNNI